MSVGVFFGIRCLFTKWLLSVAGTWCPTTKWDGPAFGGEHSQFVGTHLWVPPWVLHKMPPAHPQGGNCKGDQKGNCCRPSISLKCNLCKTLWTFPCINRCYYCTALLDLCVARSRMENQRSSVEKPVRDSFGLFIFDFWIWFCIFGFWLFGNRMAEFC